MEVSCSEDVSSNVVTIDLQDPQQQQDPETATILYSQDGHSMTELQSSDITNLYNSTSNNVVVASNIETSTMTNGDNNPETHTITIQTETKVSKSISEVDCNENSNHDTSNNNETSASSSSTSNSMTRFKWTKEKSQVAMNLVKHGCKPKLVSIAVGCSLRTAQKFVETVTPKMEGESFKNYVIRRRGRKSKDVHERLEAIREVLSKDSTKTQVEIAADLKVSNTTVCRDLKKIKGTSRKAEKTEPSSPLGKGKLSKRGVAG